MKTLFCNVTRKTFKRPEKGRSQHRLRHTFEISLAERRELRISNLSGSRNADIDCDRRVASAGERRGSHVNLVGPQRIGTWRRNAVAARFLADAGPGLPAAEQSAEDAALNPQGIRPLHRDTGIVSFAAVGIMNATGPFCTRRLHVDENFLAVRHGLSA